MADPVAEVAAAGHSPGFSPPAVSVMAIRHSPSLALAGHGR
jgi:hypothetical protein